MFILFFLILYFNTAGWSSGLMVFCVAYFVICDLLVFGLANKALDAFLRLLSLGRD